ncbi:hypothetical protein ABKV19_000386 [Rosa sericea]
MADRRAEENVVSGQPTQKTIADFDPAPKPKRNKYAFACAMLASMTSILLGYDIGVMSGAAIFIKDDLHISDVQVEVLVGILNLYSLIGSAAAGRTSDWIGRRYTIVLAGAMHLLRRISSHGLRHQLLLPHVREICCWNRRRLCPHDCSCLHRRSFSSVV